MTSKKWTKFFEKIGSSWDPELGPYFDKLQEEGQRPPGVRWLLVYSDGSELKFGYIIAPKGEGTAYRKKRKALAAALDIESGRTVPRIKMIRGDGRSEVPVLRPVIYVVLRNV